MWTAKTESLDNANVIQTVICAFAIIMVAAFLSFLMWAAANGSRYSKKKHPKTSGRLSEILLLYFAKNCQAVCCVRSTVKTALIN